MNYFQFPDRTVVSFADSYVPQDAVKITRKAYDQARRDNSRAELLKILKPGDTVTTVTTQHSKGTSASHHKLLVTDTNRDGKPYIRDITRLYAEANGHKLNRNGDAIVMSGWGYSRSFQLVYSLGGFLWPNGTPEPHGTRNGGYALNQNAL